MGRDVQLIHFFRGSNNPSPSTPPNPKPQLTVQAVFKENLFCLKETMRVEEISQSLSTLGSPIH